MKTLLKNRRVNIRISAIDLEGLQAKAAAAGLPYQTMMTSVLRKYVSGRLVDGPARLAGRSSGRQVSALPRSFELASTQYSAPSGTVKRNRPEPEFLQRPVRSAPQAVVVGSGDRAFG